MERHFFVYIIYNHLSSPGAGGGGGGGVFGSGGGTPTLTRLIPELNIFIFFSIILYIPFHL